MDLSITPKKDKVLSSKSQSPNEKSNKASSNKSFSQSQKSIKFSDRFIPISISNNLKSSLNSKEIKHSDPQTPQTTRQVLSAKRSETNYQRALMNEFLDSNSPSSNKLRFSQSKESKRNSLILKPSTITNFTTSGIVSKPKKEELPFETINYSHPLDNFYYNVLDMYDPSVICIGTKLGLLVCNTYRKVNKETNSSLFINTIGEIHAVKLTNKTTVALSTENGQLSIYDLTYSNSSPILLYKSDLERDVLSIDVNPSAPDILFTGSNNGFVEYVDIREKQKVNFLYAHRINEEVCKVKYSKHNSLLFSGGNDNQVIAFDLRKGKIMNSLKHKAAVKGIAVNEKESKMATGGGTYDKTIKLWDIKRMLLISETSTESQVTNLEFVNENKLIAGFGYIGNNVVLYDLNYNTLIENELCSERITNSKIKDPLDEAIVNIFEPIGVFEKHLKRILYMAKSFDNNWLATSSNDGMMKLWKLARFMKQTGIQSESINIR